MITLKTGGSRSGKSAFAQQQAEQINSPHLFIAICPRIDPEMDERRHQSHCSPHPVLFVQNSFDLQILGRCGR